MKSGDWKGEDKIRAAGKINRRKEATRLANVIYHKKRRERGEPCAGRAAHGAVVLAAITRGKP